MLCPLLAPADPASRWFFLLAAGPAGGHTTISGLPLSTPLCSPQVILPECVLTASHYQFCCR
jgi:hypothetical protein